MNTKGQSPSLDTIAALCAAEYGLAGRISRLGGENDNYQIVTPDGESYALKLVGDTYTSETLALEHFTVEQVYASRIGVDLPRTVVTRTGRLEARYQAEDGTRISAHLCEFLPGTPWYDAGEPDTAQLRDLGRVLAELTLALNKVDHPAAHRTHAWDLMAVSQHRGKISLVDDPEQRRILEWMFHFYTASALPHMLDLPNSMIHGDVNDENLLVQDGRITGLLDFGDCLYNPTINELAIALAYAMREMPDPLGAGAEVVAGYHSVRPLSNVELSVLYPLVCGRLCISVTMAVERRRIDPQHPDWFISEGRAWRLMERLYEIDPLEAEAQLTSGTEIALSSHHGGAVDKLLEKRHRLRG